MKTQIIQDHNGHPTGVFIPIEDWEIIKNEYPNIEASEKELEQWEKYIIDQRLMAIEKNPELLQPIDKLFQELKRKI
ncbi:addiction module component CHP02574 family protein [Flavobacterium sp.]|jgi:hypothetical protein|uniref:addiction module component CHP02574 family protein n=1 Tax=Flavobacterium sp. TaxID=239 RepID=UPI0037C11B26